MGQFINILGRQYGRLIVKALTPKREGHHVMWRCTCSCGQFKDVSSLSLRRGYTQSCGCLHRETGVRLGHRNKFGKRNPAYKDGRYCDPRKHHLVRRKRWEDRLRRFYNLTANDYNHMYKKQHGRCCICRRRRAKCNGIISAVKGLAVDHSHYTGKVRGLLCGQCNLLLGTCQDKIKTLYSAIKYLKEKK